MVIKILKIRTKRAKHIVIVSGVFGLITLGIFIPLSLIPIKYNVTLDGPLHGSSRVPIGAAIDVNHLRSNTRYREVVSTHYNALTPENVMKMGPLRPNVTDFYWDDADYLVDFAEEIGAEVHGHTLVWHNQLPQWVEDFEGNAEDWRLMLKTHIQTVVGRYKGRIAGWDVVNEAITDDGTYRNTIWYEKIGPGYIKDAFTWAAEADPDTKLYYNDFNLCSNLVKLQSSIDMISNLTAEGVAIHGIGFQVHINSRGPNKNTVDKAVSKINQIKIDVWVTELDISMNPLNLNFAYTKRLSRVQSRRYANIVESFSHAENLAGITTWGVYDGRSWRHTSDNPNWPLLFDERISPKPAANAFEDALQTHLGK